jgi:hypothetical protein
MCMRRFICCIAQATLSFTQSCAFRKNRSVYSSLKRMREIWTCFLLLNFHGMNAYPYPTWHHQRMRVTCVWHHQRMRVTCVWHHRACVSRACGIISACVTRACGIISACVSRACGIISACASQARLHSFLNTLHACTHHITKSPRVPIHAFIVPDTILALHVHTDYTSKPYCLPNASLRTNLPASFSVQVPQSVLCEFRTHTFTLPLVP